MDKAKDLLAENKPVTDVCNELGFESIGSFSTLFKKQIGYAPTYFRNMAWLKKQEALKQPVGKLCQDLSVPGSFHQYKSWLPQCVDICR